MKRKYLLKLSLLAIASVAMVSIFKVHAQTPSLSVPATTIAPTTTATPSVTPETTTEVTPTPTPKVDGVSAVVTVGTQSPWNKRIPIKVAVTTSISGERLLIRWQKKAGLVAAPTSITFASPQAGKTYTASFEMTPYATGYQRGVADIILTTKTTNVVLSKDVTLQLNSDKVVTPITPMYTFYVVMMYLTIFITFFVLIPFGAYKGYLYIKTHVFPKWLESKIQVPR